VTLRAVLLSVRRKLGAGWRATLGWRSRDRTYHDDQVEAAARAAGGLRGKSVLVVGCNTGTECRLFVRFGAGHVHGIDVVPETGAGFSHPRVSYSRTSAEAMEIDSDSFDLVFCLATMEHVGRIDFAFPELVRVAAPGGVIYSVSAPLWNSAQGHHKGDFFADFPWIHLRLNEAEILEYCAASGIEDSASGLPMETHVAYMLNDKFFNKQPAHAYVETCAALEGVEILANDLAYDDEAPLTDEILAELGAKGYPREELLASVHTFVGRKRDPSKG
jgi:SAM-dependent methyltransferase